MRAVEMDEMDILQKPNDPKDDHLNEERTAGAHIGRESIKGIYVVIGLYAELKKKYLNNRFYIALYFRNCYLKDIKAIIAVNSSRFTLIG